MLTVDHFIIRERNVLTLPRRIREASCMAGGAQGTAVVVGEGVVLLVTDPATAHSLSGRLVEWLAEAAAADPWANLNDALARGELESAPIERYVATPEPDIAPDFERIFRQYGSDDETNPEVSE